MAEVGEFADAVGVELEEDTRGGTDEGREEGHGGLEAGGFRLSDEEGGGVRFCVLWSIEGV